MKTLEQSSVFPSDISTVIVHDEDDAYGGAHKYSFTNCLGFSAGETQYAPSTQTIQFVQKQDDGNVIPGLLSEQLVIALIDRQKKLNARFPSPHSAKAIAGLELFLTAQRERVEERLQRGVMGQLAK
jgi:hypothetical protein